MEEIIFIIIIIIIIKDLILQGKNLNKIPKLNGNNEGKRAFTNEKKYI